jgi:hypothetical protein
MTWLILEENMISYKLVHEKMLPNMYLSNLGRKMLFFQTLINYIICRF